jgi:hypothetical protein
MKKSYGPAYLPTNIKAPSWLITLFVEPRAIEHVPLHIQSAALLQRVYRCLCYDYSLGFQILSNCVIDCASPDDSTMASP